MPFDFGVLRISTPIHAVTRRRCTCTAVLSARDVCRISSVDLEWKHSLPSVALPRNESSYCCCCCSNVSTSSLEEAATTVRLLLVKRRSRWAELVLADLQVQLSFSNLEYDMKVTVDPTFDGCCFTLDSDAASAIVTHFSAPRTVKTTFNIKHRRIVFVDKLFAVNYLIW